MPLLAKRMPARTALGNGAHRLAKAAASLVAILTVPACEPPEPELSTPPNCREPVAGFDRLSDEAAARGLAFDAPAGPLNHLSLSGVTAMDLDGHEDIDLMFGRRTKTAGRTLRFPRIFENDGAGQ